MTVTNEATPAPTPDPTPTPNPNPTLTVVPSTLSLEVDGTATLVAESYTGDLLWVSDNPDIAWVARSGAAAALVTAVTPGTANITVTDGSGSTAKCVVRVTAVPPTVATTFLPDGILGTIYSQTLSANGAKPITWMIASGNLPEGLSLNATTGTISGTPKTQGTFIFTVRATNSAGSATRALSIVIAATAVPPTITTTSLPDGIVRTAYSQMLGVSGTAPITWAIVSGDLPSGLNLNTVVGSTSGTITTIGVIVGSPMTVGTSSFTVQATNSAGSATKALSITIAENAADVLAEVSEIVSTLRNVKAASMMLYEDEMDAINLGWVPTAEDLTPYMPNPGILEWVYLDVENNRWWVGFDLDGKSSGVKNGLKNRAAATGLCGEKNLSVPYVDQDIVWMSAR
ncbi:MAG: Ig domain-containing protein [Synergistaceae bacterium]|nr:Ig domain-containing protein [Synergistaceae bacterium]